MSQQDQYNSVLSEARRVIEEHNARLSTSTPGGIVLSDVQTVDVDAFVRDLQTQLGGTDVESLKEASWEDLQGLGLPKLLARRVAKVFRSEPEVTAPATPAATGITGLDKLADSLRAPSVMGTDELIDRYDPSETTSPIAEELKRRFKDAKILVFNVDGVYDPIATKEVVALISSGLPEDDHYVYPGGGAEVDVFRVGQKPGMVFDLSPVHREPMRRGVCPVDRQPWGTLDLRVRQLVSIVASMGLIGEKREASVALFKVAQGGFADLEALYGDAAREFRRLEQEGKLPSLKRRAGDEPQASSNPFGVAVGHRTR